MSVCLRLSTFACVCSRLFEFSPLRLLAFAYICLRLFAFARICLRPPLFRPPLHDTEFLTNRQVGQNNTQPPLQIVAVTKNFLVQNLAVLKFRGLAKAWFSRRVVLADVPPERKLEQGYIRMFHWNENRNEGTFACSPGTKTGTRVHSPKPPFYKTALLFPLDNF